MKIKVLKKAISRAPSSYCTFFVDDVPPAVVK
jgi:hypothetical protein